MSFVFNAASSSELPDIARGPLPIMEWDLWVNSGEQVVLVADAPDEVVQNQPGMARTWLEGKAVEWFGGTVRLQRPQLTWQGETVQVRARLVDAQSH